MPSSTRPAQSPDKKHFGCTNLNIFFSSCLNICFWCSEELSKTVLVVCEIRKIDLLSYCFMGACLFFMRFIIHEERFLQTNFVKRNKTYFFSFPIS